MCVSAERHLVENIVDCFPVNSWPRALQRVPKHSLSNPHSHFARHITAFLHLAALDSPLAWSFRATFNSEITNEKHQNVKPSHRVDQETGTPVHSLWVETRRQSTPCATSAGDTHGEDPNVSLLCPRPQMHTRALQVWLWGGGSQMNFREWANTECKRNENGLYLSSFSGRERKATQRHEAPPPTTQGDVPRFRE